MRFKLPLIFAAVVASGCAYNFGASVPIGTELTAQQASPVRAGVRSISIEPFRDRRLNQTIAIVDGEPLYPAANVAVTVQRLFEKRLRARGVLVAPSGVPTVHGEVVQWNVKVKTGILGSVHQALAKVRFTIKTIDQVVLLRTSYAGSIERKRPFSSDRQVQEILDLVLAAALDEAFTDRQFVETLQLP